jgi:hypothetical protein
MSSKQAETYRNAMESLVAEEVERQMQRLAPNLLRYINTTEVVAYALNRLPALYATSEKGWRQQRLRGKSELGNQIVIAVRQALAAVQKDPLRASTPLKLQDNIESQSALQELKHVLQHEELSWRNLVDVVEQTLIKTARGEVTWQTRTASSDYQYDWRDARYRF